jgi:Kdo2-lipid IVA lauroyltransferase/acyltransferase
MPVINFIARLPMRWLYAFANFVYFLGYYVIRHRSHVIREQLEKVFPDKTEAERVALHKQYLKNYCQVFIEIVKSSAMTPEQMKSHVVIRNIEPALAYLDAGQTIMFVTSHLSNWEWLLQGMVLHLGYPLDAAYKPLHDAWSEREMLKVRTRFGARLIPAKELLGDFLKRRGIVRALAMNADQAPVSAEQRYWTKFLGHDTAFYMGAEQISRATRLPMIFIAMRRVRRGYYEVELQPLWDGRERLDPGEITERYARLCEAEVYRQPADWLWSYRRWKLKKPLYGAGGEASSEAE